jgi:putative sterol carrier protein
MADVTAEFFDDLAERGHEPLLGNASGTMRFDITDSTKTESWFVTVANGGLSVSRSGGAADSTLVASKAVFDRLAEGKASAVAEVLRGTLTIEGDWRLLVLFRRILPGRSTVKPQAAEPQRPARTGRSRR